MLWELAKEMRMLPCRFLLRRTISELLRWNEMRWWLIIKEILKQIQIQITEMAAAFANSFSSRLIAPKPLSVPPRGCSHSDKYSDPFFGEAAEELRCILVQFGSNFSPEERRKSSAVAFPSSPPNQFSFSPPGHHLGYLAQQAEKDIPTPPLRVHNPIVLNSPSSDEKPLIGNIKI